MSDDFGATATRFFGPDPTVRHRSRVLTSGLLSVATYFVALLAGDLASTTTSFHFHNPFGLLIYLMLFIVGPSWMVAGIADTGTGRWTGVGIMATTSAIAGWLTTTVDDAHAGAAIFFVPVVALALIASMGVAHLFRRRLSPPATRS